MRRTTKLSPVGDQVFKGAWELLRHYEKCFGPVPEWVINDLTLPQQVSLIATATKLHMKLADHDMVVGEYL